MKTFIIFDSALVYISEQRLAGLKLLSFEDFYTTLADEQDSADAMQCEATEAQTAKISRRVSVN
jgi:hypothetical protein